MTRKQWGYGNNPRTRHRTIPLDLLEAWLRSLDMDEHSPMTIAAAIANGEPWKWAEETGWTPNA